ncbi:phage protein [Tropicimonas sp. IMCC34011]|uniref:phage structural protein n=1 Tax=Tropicimonas sp. IMCC34011 TaxID=2248759 RepID=UPI000E267300|nr:phage protein [Tropicimonas sp. IMCC34011]
MAGLHTAYSFDQVSITLDGRTVRGMDEGDNAFEVAPMANRGEMRVGASGDSIFSGSTNKAARFTLRLMHTSPTHRQLMEKDVQSSAGVRRAFPLSFKDIGSGEGGSATGCWIEQAPTVQKGQNATVREWVIVAGDYAPSIPNEAR